MRLIDADVLDDVVYAHNNGGKCVITRNDYKLISSLMFEFPTIDVEPVRHGVWIENDNGTYSCSKCKSWIPKEQHYYARYCLHCGAKMDEVTE